MAEARITAANEFEQQKELWSELQDLFEFTREINLGRPSWQFGGKPRVRAVSKPWSAHIPCSFEAPIDFRDPVIDVQKLWWRLV